MLITLIVLATIFYGMVYQENPTISDSWDIPWYTTRERCITNVYLSNRSHFPMVYTLIHRTPYTQVEARSHS